MDVHISDPVKKQLFSPGGVKTGELAGRSQFARDGLIFFGGGPVHDFIAVYLKDSYVHFQYDLGQGTAVLRSELQVSSAKWVTIEVWRTGRGGLLKVAHQPWVEATLPEGNTKMHRVDHLLRRRTGGHFAWPDQESFQKRILRLS